MSMETFQNVDSWIASTDVTNVLTSLWNEEESGFVAEEDDNTAIAGYLTSPFTADGLGCYDVNDCLNSPTQKCCLDINEVLRYDSKTSDEFFTGWTDADVLAGAQLCSVEADDEKSLSELESLLVMDSCGSSSQLGVVGRLGDNMTVDERDLELVVDNEVDLVDYETEGDPPSAAAAAAAVSCNADEELSSEEDDSQDVTWSYRTSTTRQRRSRGRRRRPVSRRLSAASNNVTDDRKKQQNKTAATRYREKKRSEELENEMLCAELEKGNKELRTRVDDMTQEAAVLRQLVIDIFRSPTNI